jgi:nucleoside-diphosphate-sugar epimerase
VTGTILITGGDGYLGRRIAARLLAGTSDRLVLTVHSAGEADLSARRAALRREFAPAGLASQRARVLHADLAADDPFAAVDPAGITGIVHTAARTAFTIDQQLARQVNIGGTERLAAFARRCPGLERLLVLSTLFSAGRQTGTVAEAPHAGPRGFVNYYEWSKYEAERHLFGACADLPLCVARVATVIAADDSGSVTQYNVFHNTLKLFFYGLLSLMPGDPATRLYLTTASFTAGAAVRLLAPEVPAGVYHLSPAPAETVTLGEAIDIVFTAFESDAGFRRRRLLRPGLCDLESFRYLAQATQGLSASPLAQAAGSVTPFAEQMFLPKEFENRRLRAAWPQYPGTDPAALITAVSEQLVATRWGREIPARMAGQALEEVR